MNIEAQKKMIKARASLVLNNPFFASIALRLDVIEDNNQPTAWINGVQLGYNADFINQLPINELKGLYCHEILHVVFLHHLRRDNRDFETWNKACDYAINQILIDSNIELPKGALLNSNFKDLNAEKIYSKLYVAPQDNQSNQSKQGQGAPNNSNQGQGQGNQNKGQQGQSNQSNSQKQLTIDNNCGQVRDCPNKNGGPLSEAEKSLKEQEIKIAVAQAAQQAKTCGQLPASIARLIDDILAPKITWQDILKEFVNNSAKNDYSWGKPNNRYIHKGLYLPSLNSNELKNIVVAIDTSGSISKSDLEQFAAELTEILESYKSNCTLIYCDSEIQEIKELTYNDLPLDLNPVGGGGTDFRPPFNYVNDNDIATTCFIYLTDLCCYDYPTSPNYPVLWVQLGDYNFKAPPFGQVLKI